MKTLPTILLLIIMSTALAFSDSTEWQRFTEAEKDAYLRGFTQGTLYTLEVLYNTLYETVANNPLSAFNEPLKPIIERFYMQPSNKEVPLYYAIYMAIISFYKEQGELR